MDAMLAREATFVAVDFESTGHAPGYPDEPWQIGLVPVVRGEINMHDAFVTYLHVSPERPFSPFAPGSWRMVRPALSTAPPLQDLWPSLRSRIAGYPLVAHNAPTEKKFFRKAWPLHKTGPWVDTLKLSRKAFAGLPSYELSAVVEAAGLAQPLANMVPDRESHDALYDAAACALLLVHFLSQPSWSNLRVSDLVSR